MLKSTNPLIYKGNSGKIFGTLLISYKEIPSEIQEKLDLISTHIEKPPIVSSHISEKPSLKGVRGVFEKEIIEKISDIEKTTKSLGVIDLSVSVPDPQSGGPQLLIKLGFPMAWCVQPAENNQQIMRLRRIKEIDDHAAKNGALCVEDGVEKSLVTCTEKLNKLNKVRTYSLIEHIAKSVKGIQDSSYYSCVRFVCPYCLKRNTKETDSLSADSRIAIIRGKAQNKRVADWHEVLRSSTLLFSRAKDSYVCQLCGENFLLDNSVPKIHRAKEELVFPVWDRLWSELDVERNRILREKETQLRDLRTQEQSQLQFIHSEFDSERLSIRQRLDAMVESITKLKGSLKGLLSALNELGLTSTESSGSYEALIVQYENKAKEDVSCLRRSMKDFDDLLRSLDGDAFNRHFSLMDEIDAVKSGNRLIEEQ